jgi:drug/metabolite transporter (DMT)-like permease
VLWGFTAVLGKLITLASLPLVMWRMLLASTILGILAYATHKLSVTFKDGIMLMSLGVLLALHWISFYASVKAANASVAVVCISISSLFVAIFSPIIYNERFRKSHLFLGILMLIGIVVIFGTLDRNYKIGLYYGILASFLVSIFSILNKSLAGRLHPYTIVFWEMIGGFIFLFIILILNNLLYKNISTSLNVNEMPYFVFFVIFCTVIPLVISTAALKQLSAFVSVFLVNLEPIYGMILAAWFLNENQQLTDRFYYGSGIILSGIFIQIWWERRLSPSKA